MLCICSFLMLAGLASRGDAVPPGYVSGSEETGNDTPLAPARQGRLGTRVPRQRCKSPAELDFYGEFYAACCGRPVRPPCRRQDWAEIAHTECAQQSCLRHDCSLSIKLFYPIFPLSRGSAHEIDFAAQNHKNRGRVPRFLYSEREKVSVWELSDVCVLRRVALSKHCLSAGRSPATA